MDAMSALRAGIGLIWLLSLLAGRGSWQTASASPIHATSAEITDYSLMTPGKASGDQSTESDRPESRFDLFGNEVEDALADYRIDVRGSVYERHSPDTAVQHLGSPST